VDRALALAQDDGRPVDAAAASASREEIAALTARAEKTIGESVANVVDRALALAQDVRLDGDGDRLREARGRLARLVEGNDALAREETILRGVSQAQMAVARIQLGQKTVELAPRRRTTR
jgi:hypothetical protein